MYKMVYSNTLECMVVSGFTVQRVAIDKSGLTNYKIYEPKHYTWDDDDCVYRRDDVDDVWFENIPRNGRRCLMLTLLYRGRFLVKLDKE